MVEAASGGVGRHVLDLADGLADQGDIVDLAYGVRRADEAFHARLRGAAVRSTTPLDASRGFGPSDLEATRRVRCLARSGDYDVIHGHASKGGLYARLSARRHGPAVVYTPNALITQSTELGRGARVVYSMAERVLARRTDGLVHVSPEERKHARELGLRPKVDRIVPNGISMNPLPAPDAARRAFGLPNNTLVVGFVGRLSRQKGVDVLLRAASRVPSSAGEWCLAIVGSGEEEQPLRRLSSELGLDGRIRWMGHISGQEVMPAFDLLVIPSRYEGFPYVVLEGLWAEVPVIATRGSGSDLLLGDGRTGVLIPCDDPDELGRAVTEMLCSASARAERSARSHEVVAPFTVERMVRSTRGLYLDVLERRFDRHRCPAR